MASGNITLDTLTDEQFIKVIQIKDNSAGKLSFRVGQPIGIVQQGQAGKTTVNGVSLSFGDAEGAKFAAEIFQMLSS